MRPRVFGDLSRNSMIDTWNDPLYRAFRKNVSSRDDPSCSNCNLGPCDYIRADDFEQDCYVNHEPCGDRLWFAGLFHCME